jgi:hypothetical protein
MRSDLAEDNNIVPGFSKTVGNKGGGRQKAKEKWWEGDQAEGRELSSSSKPPSRSDKQRRLPDFSSKSHFRAEGQLG